jgi:hypothetical protein
MNQEPEIVFKTTVGNLVCQVIKSGYGYVRQQTFSTGLVFEEDYTEEEYQDFLRRMKAFNALSTHNKSANKSSKQNG